MRWLIFAIAAAACAAPVEVTPTVIRQGETVRVAAGPEAASARLNGRVVRLFPETSGVSGLMPIGVEEKPGAHTLEVLDANGAVLDSAAITVRDARYPTQNIVVSQALAELKPAPGEAEMVASFRMLVTDVRRWKEPFEKPVPGCMTSRFGVKRLRNGKPTGDYHAGLDLRARTGDPVRATAAGTVVIARPLTLQGGTVGIDHGQGVESMYMHLSKIEAVEGAQVQPGDIVGHAGSTGRSTAPHLHWGIYVHGMAVSPLQWVSVRSCTGGAGPARKQRAAGE